MKSRAVMVTGVAVAMLSLSACGTVETALSPLSKTTTATVTQIPGVTTPHVDAALNAGTRWVVGPDGTGLFAVGNQPRDGLMAIPAGQYRIEVGDSGRDGNWMVCESALCGPKYEENAAEIGHAHAPYNSTIALSSKARTLWIDNLTLTRVDSDRAN